MSNDLEIIKRTIRYELSSEAGQNESYHNFMDDLKKLGFRRIKQKKQIDFLLVSFDSIRRLSSILWQGHFLFRYRNGFWINKKFNFKDLRSVIDLIKEFKP